MACRDVAEELLPGMWEALVARHGLRRGRPAADDPRRAGFDHFVACLVRECGVAPPDPRTVEWIAYERLGVPQIAMRVRRGGYWYVDSGSTAGTAAGLTYTPLWTTSTSTTWRYL